MKSSIFLRKTFCVITGSSQGFGKCLAETFASKLPAGSTLLLLARQQDKLQDVKTTISSTSPNINVLYHSFDQSKLKQCDKEAISRMLKDLNVDIEKFEQLLLVHNAGTTGDLTRYGSQLTDMSLVEDVMNVNVSGTILLNASFLSMFSKDVVQHRVVINVSSLAAVKAFPSWSLYCTGKSARDMFFQTLAKEDSSIRVVNYAPGPLDTDMQKSCRESADDDIRQMMTDMHKNGTLLSCSESVAKLVTLLHENTFESGAHIDFYDI